MEKDTNIIFRVNSKLKNSATKVARKYGVSLTELITACLVEFDKRDFVPLNIRRHFPNKYIKDNQITIALIKMFVNSCIEKQEKKDLIKKAYLFGSFARGEETPKSDIDIRLEADRGLTLIDLGNLRQDIVDATGKQVDLLCVKPESLDPNFYNKIRKEEICIYER